MRGLDMFKLTLSALGLLIVLTEQSAAACPVASLTAKLDQSLRKLTVRQVDVSERQSTEGGVWRIFLTRAGKVRLLQRSDYGETGQWQASLALTDRNNFVIRAVDTKYREPINAERTTIISSKTSREYVFRDDGSYVPAPLDAGDDPKQVGLSAESLKRMFFSAPEIAKYLPK